MPHHQRGLRAELAAILSVDQYSLDDLVDDPAPPYEPTSTRLAHLIIHAIHHPIEARAVYAFLPVLMLRIFGFTAGQGWLETISQLPSKDRDALLAVVMPDGPLHSFCKQASSQPPDGEVQPASTVSSVPGVRDMRFEFSVANLPPGTRQALASSENGVLADDGPNHSFSSAFPNGDSVPSLNYQHQPQSYLAPILRPMVVSRYGGDVLLLDPLMYFTLCLIASPANKYASDGVPEGTNPITAKRIKRSTSLPSTRALYNQVLAAYLKCCTPMQRADAAPVIIPAVLDFLFLPWALATPDVAPIPSAAAGDAISTVLLSLVPPAPEGLELQPGVSIEDGPPPPAPLTSLTTAAALYRLVPYIVYNAFAHLTPGDTTAVPFLAFVRVLALHIAPWKSSVRASLRAMLFAKPKRSTAGARGNATGSASNSNHLVSVGSSNGNGTPTNGYRFGLNSVKGGVVEVVGTMQEASSSLANTVVAHLSAVHRSPDRPPPATDARWRTAVSDRVCTLDMQLVSAAIVRAAALRVGAIPDGARSLAALTESTQAARMASRSSAAYSNGSGAAARADELALCLESIRSSVTALDPKGLSKWERGFVPTLASAVGIRLQQSGGYLQNLSDSAQSVVKDVVGRVSGNGLSSAYYSSPHTNGHHRLQKSGSRSGSRRSNGGATNYVGSSPGSGQSGRLSTSPSSSSKSLKRRRVHERRLSLLNGTTHGPGDSDLDPVETPFFGSVWDRPIEGGEFEPMVLFAYWLAIRLEPHIGYLPDIRFMGRFWFLLAIATVSLIVMLVRAAIAVRS